MTKNDTHSASRTPPSTQRISADGDHVFQQDDNTLYSTGDEADNPAMAYRPPVVLQVLPEMETGGVERGTVDVAHFTKYAGATPIVASEGGRLVHDLERNGITHITLPLASKNPLVIRSNINELCSIIKQYKVDIIHARSRAPAWSAFFAARRMGIPFLTTFHSTYSFSSPWKKLYNSVMTRGDRVIAISNFVAHPIHHNYGTPLNKIRTIHRGTDVHTFNPDYVTAERMATLSAKWRLPDEKKIIFCPARVTPRKGHMVLLEALAKLDRRDFYCVIAGSSQGRDSYVAAIEETVTKLNLEGHVSMVGDCRDMPTALMLADVVVAPSIDEEAFGRVPSEAQAMGRPVIASDTGGMCETVIDGETGWLVPPRDPDALARALDKALSLTEDERISMACLAIAHVNGNFSMEQMCWQTLDVYRELYSRPVPWEEG